MSESLCGRGRARAQDWSRKRQWSRKRCWRERKQRGQQWCLTTHLGRCESRRIWTTRIYSTERTWCPFPHDIVSLKGKSTFQAVLSGTSSWSVFQGLRRSVRPKTKFEPQFGQHFILQNWWAWSCWKVCETLFQNIYVLLIEILHHKKVTASKQKLVKSALFPHT